MRTIKVGALFAGYGGIEMALAQIAEENPGVEIVLAWYCEVDPHASAILAHRYPGVPNHGDVTKVAWADVEEVDVITGGSPCQDLSHAGKRAGMKAGTRSGLWASMCDAIDIIRPSLVIWENVRGALSAEADSAVEPCPICVGDGGRVTLRALGRVLGDLAELGYDSRWYGLRAADVGAAHGRFRVFVLSHPARNANGADVEGIWPRRVEEPRLAAGARERRGAGADSANGLTLLPTPAVNDMGEGKTVEAWDAWTAKMQAAHGNGNGHGKSLAIEAQRLDCDIPLFPTPRTSDTNEAGKHGQGGPDLRTVVDLLPTPRATRGGSATETTALLPTPRATDGTKGGPNQRGSSGDLMLPSAVHLLPTPSASQAGGTAEAHRERKRRSMGRTNPTCTDLGLVVADETTRWGDYAAAIARWETVTGRPAPEPTEVMWEAFEKAKQKRLNSTLPIGMRGSINFILRGPNRRLSAQFVEWLMGLPAGWVTDIPGITRNHALKALGNGVVPQQCAAAIRAYIHDEINDARSIA